MGMPIMVEIVDPFVRDEIFSSVFDYFISIDERFSTYKETSEITKINQGLITVSDYSDDMKTVFALCEETKKLTHGYFDIQGRSGKIDPSGLVKGWSIFHAAELLKKMGCKNFFIDAGGDIEAFGKNRHGELWSVGIRHPFNENEIVKVVYLKNQGIATSGTYIRGQHIYNPFDKKRLITDIVSLTVIGPNVYEADRFATAAFAMGRTGISFIESLPGFEGYVIDKEGKATMTTNFAYYTTPYVAMD